MTQPGTLPPCPFIAGPMIQDPRLFVGRKSELKYLAEHLTGAQPISVNVVGERRIGKSSLLYHFFQTWEQRVPSVNDYIVVFLSLQDASCRHKHDFYRSVAAALLHGATKRGRVELITTLQNRNMDGQSFASAMQEWKRYGVLPVLCLDEFESLLKDRHEFDDAFYDGLRALMDDNALMLVVNSLKPLDTYQLKHSWIARMRNSQPPLTSSFFNLGHTKVLGEMPEDEIADLVRLPASTVQNTSAALSMDEQRLAKKWAGGHPYLLQLAATCLCQARQEGRDEAHAETQFRLEASRLPNRRRERLSHLRWLVWDGPQAIGRVIKRTGNAADELTNWLLGLGLILLVALGVVGVLTQTQLVDLVQRLFGIAP